MELAGTKHSNVICRGEVAELPANPAPIWSAPPGPARAGRRVAMIQSELENTALPLLEGLRNRGAGLCAYRAPARESGRDGARRRRAALLRVVAAPAGKAIDSGLSGGAGLKPTDAITVAHD